MQIGPLEIASEFWQTSPVHGSSLPANGMVAFIQTTATPDHSPSLPIGVFRNNRLSAPEANPAHI
jgi:hypothetical protein